MSVPVVDNALVFLHIPKTGGSTLCNILSQVYRFKAKVVHIPKNDNFKGLGPMDQKKYTVVHGHQAFQTHREFIETHNTEFITMLREPISRIISNYYFILRHKKHPLRKPLVDNNYSLKEYVEIGLRPNTENAQVRLLANCVKIPHGTCTREMLETAKHNLKHHMSVVGLTDKFDESLVLMQNKLNWRTPFYMKSNVTGHGVKAKDLDQETMDVILKYNALDIELYQYAQELYEEQVKGFKGNLELETAKFRKKNKRVQPIIKLKRKIF